MAHTYRVAVSTVRRWRQERGIPSPGREYPRDAPNVIPEREHQSWHLGPDALGGHLWDTLEQLQRGMDALDIERDEVSVTLPDDRPVLIVFSSDWHCGHTSCQMPRLRRDLELIRATPGCYAILGGDLLDNPNTSVLSRGMSHEQLAPLRIQKQLVEEATEYLGAENVLAMLLGNHDAWSIRTDDFDPIAYLCKRLGCPYLGAYGFVNVTLGAQTYRILAAHQFRMRSSFNKTHQGKRLMDFMGSADVVFTGHTHDSAVEMTHIRQKPVFIGQAGSYLRSSRYSKALGFTPSSPEMPGALLFPHEHKVIPVYDAFTEGLFILNAYRA